MIWDYETLLNTNDPLTLPGTYTSRLLAIDIVAGNFRSSWHNAGYLIPLVTIDNLTFSGK